MQKKTRFEVFKRDGFKCQYCGRTPPAVTLEVDHINPKSNDGVENVNNYITACFDCNRGKGKGLLTELPTSLGDNLQQLQERQKQLKAYNRYLEDQERHYTEAIAAITALFEENFPNEELTPSFCAGSVRRLLQLLPPAQVKQAMASACGKMPTPERAIQYFCGICWNWIKNPETREW